MLLGICVDAIPPQVWLALVTPGFAVFCRSSLVAAIFLTREGRADHNNATTPATCGDAIEVPDKLEYAVSLVLVIDLTFEPGAEMFGFKIFGL